MLLQIRRKEQLCAGDRVGVAVSGGTDSVALQRLLFELRGELGIVLAVVHFNHKLRGAESDRDAEFVENLAREHGLEFFCDSKDVAEHASQENLSLEAAARELRYGFFRCLLGSESTPGTRALYGGDPQGLKPASIEAGDGAAKSRALSRIHESRLGKIVTGHTLDDQAETVLMRLIRGTGLSGLSGIHPRIAVEGGDGEICGEIVRPLLETRRRELERYLRDIGQPWRDDSTNASHAFTRNRVRHLVVPLLESEFNPAVAQNLAELAEIARSEDEYWDNEVAGWMGTAVHWIEPDWLQQAVQRANLVQIAVLGSAAAMSPNADWQARIENADWLVMNASVSRAWLLSEPVAVQRRVVKAVGDYAGIPLEFKHVEEVLRFADEERVPGKELSLPRGWKVLRRPEELLFVTPDLRDEPAAQNYDYDLSVPGRIVISESGKVIVAQAIPADAAWAYNPDELLRADSLPGPLKVRNWRAGDRFWPAHTKSPKKIKELLQERHVEQPRRSSWPVVLSGDEIVWVLGFAVHAKHRAEPRGRSIRITESDESQTR
jgi:tRNA(Ile)-lysidine synthase